MTHHLEAWNHVKPHLFGKVCEVARRTPWGFIEDDPSIINVSVYEFLDSMERYDTIILHILSGEDEPKKSMKQVIKSALTRCIKVVILEHNPDSDDFTGLEPIGYIRDMINKDAIYENWGRNMLFACTTFKYLQLHNLNDQYYNDNINKSFIGVRDHGIDSKELIYTHTSESQIDFDLPVNSGYVWVIGGGIAYESMKAGSRNILVDAILKQVLYAAWLYEPDKWKVERLYDFSNLEVKEWSGWRVVELNGVEPDVILHLPLLQLKYKDHVIYVSTVHKDHWEHLIKDNIILDAWTNRDKIQVY